MKRRHVPINSLGEEWRPGQTWSCSRCGRSGPDRDDVALPECRQRSYHDLTFHPPAHASAIKQREEVWRG